MVNGVGEGRLGFRHQYRRRETLARRAPEAALATLDGVRDVASRRRDVEWGRRVVALGE